MSSKQIKPLTYDPSAVVIEETGLAANDLASLAGRLNDARVEVDQTDVALWESGADVPDEKQPLDAGFYKMPEKLLAEYKADRQGSELGRILATAERLRNEVDRVVLLGIGGSYMGARALFESCCHPYHNEQSRAERGSKPRIYFAGDNVDNDASAGLLDLFKDAKASKGVDERWAAVVISKSGGTLETATAFRQYLSALQESCDGDAAEVAKLVVPVTGKSGKLFDLATDLGCDEIFAVPDGVGGRFSILSAVGLLPAAIMGLDIVKLLEGAAAMNEHFRTAPVGENAVLDYVGVCHLLESRRNIVTRVLSIWSKSLEAAGLWYDQLLAESLGKDFRGALPLTVVNTRDLHSRGQQHQEGTRDKLITNVIVDEYRRSHLKVGQSERNQDQLNELADKSLPDIMAAAIEGTNKAYNDVQRPTADLHLPAADEASLGQLFQMLMLATVVEGRLLDINPYGQPGVEAYKINMNAILRR